MSEMWSFNSCGAALCGPAAKVVIVRTRLEGFDNRGLGRDRSSSKGGLAKGIWQSCSEDDIWELEGC